MQQSACDGYALCLSLAESAALFAAWGVESLGELEYEVGHGDLECVAELLFGGIGIAEQEVVAYGAGEECVALRDVGEVDACGG